MQISDLTESNAKYQILPTKLGQKCEVKKCSLPGSWQHSPCLLSGEAKADRVNKTLFICRGYRINKTVVMNEQNG